jgi:hypothetical protein
MLGAQMQPARAAIAIAILVAAALTLAAQEKPTTPAPQKFTDADGADVLSRLQKAFESNRQSRVLQVFDSARMPGFAAFRDQLIQFQTQYPQVLMRHKLQQTAQDNDLGAVVADLEMEATPLSDGAPVLRRRAQVRFVLSWDGKAWRIADLTPRNFFQ